MIWLAVDGAVVYSSVSGYSTDDTNSCSLYRHFWSCERLKMNIAKTKVMVVDNTPINVNNVLIEN